MKLKFWIRSALLAAGLLATIPAQALPAISQAGNLLGNGNFESGSGTPVSSGQGAAAASALGSWNQYSNSAGGTTSMWLDAPLIEGDHVAFVDANGPNNGLYQYFGLGGGTYTISGWFYVLTGSVKLGMAWNSGSAAAFGAETSTTRQWQYLSATLGGVAGSLGGALLYGGNAGGEFYAEGIWLNTGSDNLSPFAPGNGFTLPGTAPTNVPEPAMWALLLAAAAGMRLMRRR